MSEYSYYTQEGLDKLNAELAQLERYDRPAASKAIAEARDKGDLSENAEYDAAKEAQGMLEMKISKLKNILANARVIDESKLDVSKVLILSKVKVNNLKLKKKMDFTLVAEKEANLADGKISVTSPIGKALLGNKVGDTVDVETPGGIMKMEILEISR